MTDKKSLDKKDSFSEVISAVEKKAKTDLLDTILNDLPKIPSEIEELRKMIEDGFISWQNQSCQCETKFKNIFDEIKESKDKIVKLEKKNAKIILLLFCFVIFILIGNGQDLNSIFKTLFSLVGLMNGAF